MRRAITSLESFTRVALIASRLKIRSSRNDPNDFPLAFSMIMPSKQKPVLEYENSSPGSISSGSRATRSMSESAE